MSVHWYLDDDVTFSGTSAVKFSMFFYHDNFPLLFNFLHVFLHLVQNAAIILLSYTNKLVENKKKITKISNITKMSLDISITALLLHESSNGTSTGEN